MVERGLQYLKKKKKLKLRKTGVLKKEPTVRTGALTNNRLGGTVHNGRGASKSGNGHF